MLARALLNRHTLTVSCTRLLLASKAAFHDPRWLLGQNLGGFCFFLIPRKGIPLK